MAGARKSELQPGLRVDRWLWCARFFKTRSSAAQAVRAGHVRVDGRRIKPAYDIKIGDVIVVAHDDAQLELTVAAIPVRRGPATEALRCYVESPESIARRAARIEHRAAAPRPAAPTPGRPDKRTRRLMLRARQRAE